MKVNLKRLDDAFHFEAVGSSGIKIYTDGAPDIGGHDLGLRPMELLLTGLASCSAIDMILILKKQRQIIEDFEISIEGERVKEENTERSPFSKIHIVYRIKGQIDAAKAERAAALSMQKYCSATAQFEPLASISYEILIVD